MNVTEIVNHTAGKLAEIEGWTFPEGHDFQNDTHPRGRRWFRMAEAAYEGVTGDSPDYSEDEE